MNDNDIKKILNVGTIFVIGVASSYVIRAYLDILRIKQIKKELNQNN